MTAQNGMVGIKVRGIAAEKRATQQDIADVLKSSRVLVSSRLKGKTPFTADELTILSEYFDVPVGAFFGEVLATAKDNS